MIMMFAVLLCYLGSRERKANPDLCDAGAVLHQLNYQANWEQVVVWVEYKRVDVEIGTTIKFIHSNPHFKCMENSGIIMYCLSLFNREIFLLM